MFTFFPCLFDPRLILDRTLFVPQNESRNSPNGSPGRTAHDGTALDDNEVVDQGAVEQDGEDHTVGVAMHGESNVSGVSKETKSTMPRLGGLLNVTPRRVPMSSPNLANNPNTLDDVTQLSTPVHDAPSQAPKESSSKTIKRSNSPTPRPGGGSRAGSVRSVKREPNSPFFGTERKFRLSSVSSIKLELLDEEDIVVTSFRSKIIDPSANGETVDLTLDD